MMKLKRKSRQTPFGLTAAGAISEIRRSEENAKLRRVVGERFISAREINGLQQQEAAHMIGYGNGTQLSLIEQGDRLPPLPVFMRAVEVYGVSLDYLTGLSDEPERDPRIAEKQSAMRHVSGLVTGLSEVLVTQLQHYLTRGAPSVIATRSLLQSGQALIDAVQTMRARNAEAFDELLGGATVERTHSDFSRDLLTAKSILDRHDRISEEVIRRVEDRSGITRPLFAQADQQAG